MSLIDRFGFWFANSPVASAVKAFVAIVVSMAVADWVTSSTISFSKWQTWVIAALAAAIVPALNAANRADYRYGAWKSGTQTVSTPDGEK